MLTIEKFKIYRAYQGDVDAYVRCGTKKEREIVNDSDFYAFKDLIQDIILQRRGLTSREYIQSLDQKIQSNAAELIDYDAFWEYLHKIEIKNEK